MRCEIKFHRTVAAMNPGETFILAQNSGNVYDNVYMKTNEVEIGSYKYNTVNVRTGELLCFGGGTQAIPVFGKFTTEV